MNLLRFIWIISFKHVWICIVVLLFCCFVVLLFFYWFLVFECVLFHTVFTSNNTNNKSANDINVQSSKYTRTSARDCSLKSNQQYYVIKSVTFSWSVCFSGSSTNKIDSHDVTDILLKVALNSITLTRINTIAGFITKR